MPISPSSSPRRAIVAAAALMLSVHAPALAAQHAARAPAATLPSAERRRIDSVFAAYDHASTPGCALGVMQHGRMAYARGYGSADLERHVPITPATLFDIGSTSKQFAAASLALLVEDGRIAFTDDVRTYISELPDYGAPITIDHLLRHTSGLRDYNGLLALAGHSLEEVTTDSQALALIVRQRHLNFPTGSRYEYSNTGYFLASVIVQRVTGKSLADFARARIFTPLGMTHTRYRNAFAMLIPNRALGYAPDGAGGYVLSMSNWEETGDGGVHLSVDDALAWDENFYHPRVGGPRLPAALQARGALDDGDSIGYGRGLFLDRYRGLRRVSHGGDWIGYHAAYARFPDQHTSVIVLCNADGIFPTTLADRVTDIVLAGAFPEPPAIAASARDSAGGSGRAPSSTPPHAQLVGTYFRATTNSVFRVTDDSGTLTLHLGGLALPLTPRGGATFAVAGYPATVELSAEGDRPARALRLRIESDEAEDAERIAVVAPPDSALPAYVGMYYSPELDVAWDIGLRDGHLELSHVKASLVSFGGPFVPVQRDAFTAGAGYFHFTRDAAGRVTGFDLSASRMRDIRFDRRASAAAP